MKANSKIQMTFKCDQNWDDMSFTESGRFCDICKKEVVDFTNKSTSEFKDYLIQHEILCGNFTIDQVDTSLIRPIEIPKKIKRFAFLSTFALFISTSNSYGQKVDSVKTEQNNFKGHPSNENLDNKDNTESNDCEKTSRVFPDKRKIFTTKKKIYYWSRKFPFISREYKTIRGNVRNL